MSGSSTSRTKLVFVFVWVIPEGGFRDFPGPALSVVCPSRSQAIEKPAGWRTGQKRPLWTKMPRQCSTSVEDWTVQVLSAGGPQHNLAPQPSSALLRSVFAALQSAQDICPSPGRDMYSCTGLCS